MKSIRILWSNSELACEREATKAALLVKPKEGDGLAPLGPVARHYSLHNSPASFRVDRDRPSINDEHIVDVERVRELAASTAVQMVMTRRNLIRA